MVSFSIKFISGKIPNKISLLHKLLFIYFFLLFISFFFFFLGGGGGGGGGWGSNLDRLLV